MSLNNGGLFSKTKEFEDEQVDLLKAFNIISDGRRAILIITAFFTCLGILHYLKESPEYESESIIIRDTETNEEFQQLIWRINERSGVSTESTLVGITAGLYRDIVYSVEFQRDLLYSDLRLSNASNTKLFDYLSLLGSKYIESNSHSILHRLNLNTEPIRITSNNKYLQLSKEEARFIDVMRHRIKIDIKNGLISVKVILPDPVAAASLNMTIIENLQDYITQYQIERARDMLIFTELRHKHAEEQYHATQFELAEFSDKNIFLSTALARTQLEDLQNKQSLHFDIYNLTSHEVEGARLRVQEEKPIFFALQRPTIAGSPINRSGAVITIAIIMGFILSIMWVLFRSLSPSFKNSH